MSKGLGHVQRAVIATFAAEPGSRFTVGELAALVYPGQPIEKKHTEAVNRVLRNLAAEIGLHRCRVSPSSRHGWHHRWGLASGG